MKRTALKRKSKSPIRKTQDELWELCKKITRKRYGNICYTCGKTGLEGSGWHTGHMWAKASLGAYLKYDLRVLRPQCYFCNINCGGQGATFYAKMLKENGKKYMEKLEQDKNISVKAIDHYIKLINDYSRLLEAQ